MSSVASARSAEPALTVPPDRPPGFVVVKVGGSLVSDKRRSRHIDDDLLDRYAGLVADLARLRPGRVAFVAGGGAYGHGAVRDVDRSDAFGLLDLTEATFAVKWAWTRAFRAHGVRAMPLQVAAMCLLGEEGPRLQHAVLEQLLEQGTLPVLSGDCVLDGAGRLRLMGSDEVPSLFLGVGTAPIRVVTLTDVDGVLADGPGGDRVIPYLDPDEPGQWSAQVWAAQHWDTSGAMGGKVAALSRMAAAGAECVIMKGDPAASDLRFLLEPRSSWRAGMRCTVIAATATGAVGTGVPGQPPSAEPEEGGPRADRGR